MNKKIITERLLQAIWTCERASEVYKEPFFIENAERLKENIASISKAFSGSWLGYHANVYYRGLNRPEPGDNFSPEWGLMDAYFSGGSSHNWIEQSPETIEAVAYEGVDESYIERLGKLSEAARTTLKEQHRVITTIVEAILSTKQTEALTRIDTEIKKIQTEVTPSDVIDVMRPKGRLMSRDTNAVSQGIRAPIHARVEAQHIAFMHPFVALEQLSADARSILSYMEIHDLIERNVMTTGDKIFIGHGRSLVWRELKDFLQDRLNLRWEEFNREPTAGMATSERLQEMLNNSLFALLIMTAEDEHADNSLHARENVVHEVGLFQGKLGFRKAIVLLEEGCTEFSNIVGLSQLRFPKGRISACFEEIRRVLEREGVI